MSKAGYGQEDFAAGGYSGGRLKVSTFRCEIPKSEKGGKQGPTAVLHGRDGAGALQDVWLTLGGDAEESTKKFKAGGGGKWIECRTDAKPAAQSKYGLFMASLRTVGFPMSRFAEMDMAALDGVTLQIESKVMDLSPEIRARIEREKKRVPTYYVVTAFELPSAGGDEKDAEDDGDDEPEEKPKAKAKALTPEAKLEKFVRGALAKAGAGEAVPLKTLTQALAVKFEDDDDLEEMVAGLTLAAVGEFEGVTVDKKAKTVTLDE